jgi:hypothetical protein
VLRERSNAVISRTGSSRQIVQIKKLRGKLP